MLNERAIDFFVVGSCGLQQDDLFHFGKISDTYTKVVELNRLEVEVRNADT